MRRAFFQIHLWTGLVVGLYTVIVFTTGATLVFRIDLQRALDPHLFTPTTPGPIADAATVMERVAAAYPEHRLSGVDAPTTSRPTYLAYLTREGTYVTVLIDPASAQVLGELPERSVIRFLQNLHYDLLAGRTGRIVNGIGAGCVLLMCLTGAVIWWPGAKHLIDGFTVNVRRNWRRVIWELHRAIGAWTVILTAMWAITGLYFVFPAQVRSIVNWVSPTTLRRAPVSKVPTVKPLPTVSWRRAVEEAQRHAPDHFVARVVLPGSFERAPFLVLFAATQPTPTGPGQLSSVYLDRYTLARLPEITGNQSPGDVILTWLTPLHVGNFGGMPVKIAWLILGLAPPVLFATGFVTWWTRVVRPTRRIEKSRSSAVPKH